MRILNKTRLLSLGFLCSLICYGAPTVEKVNSENLRLQTLFYSLDPLSISQLFAFYELYPQSDCGAEALKKVWELFHIHKNKNAIQLPRLLLPKLDIQPVIALVNKQTYEAPVYLSEEDLKTIESLGSHLKNRDLIGHQITTSEALISLPSEEIDLARALLIYQYQKSPHAFLEIRRYEATLDLMALQILARLSPTSTPLEKVYAINHFIFHEMGFRFPPHSLMSKEIDLYTFLPSVLDNRKGVCLGVSILFLSLAQRIGLPLEIITPPGHIYLRYHEGDTLVNIETTARGVHMPTDTYLGINTYTLSTRTIKEVVGMAFINQASILWHQKNYAGALDLYLQAEIYLPDDPLLKMFTGLQYLLLGKKDLGYKLLKPLQKMAFPDTIYPDTLPEDILTYQIDTKALESVFMEVDETRESILKKKAALQETLYRYPKFRSALMQLAVCWLQLGRSKEALELLHHYHQLDSQDPTINYYLCALSLQRLQYQEAWRFLIETQEILKSKNHQPKALTGLQYHLRYLLCDFLHED